MSETRVPFISGLITQLSVMHSHKHIYTGILNMSEEAYKRMLDRQKKSIEDVRNDPRYSEWP